MTNRTLPGSRVGHAADRRGLTGLTVILCERGALSSVDVRGGAAGTRDLETCRPGHIAERAHAILLTGGSAFGLDSAAGVMRYLESRGAGFAAGPSRVSPGVVSQIRVPIVPAACIFDLAIGSSRAWPDARMASRACRAASGPGGRFVREGSVGAGTGATVGKIKGIACAMKGGVGFWSVTLPAMSSEKRGSDFAKLGRVSPYSSSPPAGSVRKGDGWGSTGGVTRIAGSSASSFNLSSPRGRGSKESGGLSSKSGGKVIISRAGEVDFGGRLAAGVSKSAGNSGGGASSLRGVTADSSANTGKSRGGGATVQALAVVNALGDVLNPNDGSILAGARKNPRSRQFVGATAEMLQALDRKAFGNTTLVVIMTDAAIPRQLLQQLTQKVHKAFVRTIFPVHTRFDGDSVFGLALGRKKADLASLADAAVDAAARAIARAVICARGLGGVPSLHDLARRRD